ISKMPTRSSRPSEPRVQSGEPESLASRRHVPPTCHSGRQCPLAQVGPADLALARRQLAGSDLGAILVETLTSACEPVVRLSVAPETRAWTQVVPRVPSRWLLVRQPGRARRIGRSARRRRATVRCPPTDASRLLRLALPCHRQRGSSLGDEPAA